MPLPRSPCIECGKILDAATPVGHEFKPKPGSFSVCAYCAALSVYDDEMRLRLPTLDEVDELRESPQWAYVNVAREVIMRRSKVH